MTFFVATGAIIGDCFYADIKSVMRRRLVLQMEVYTNVMLAFINFVVAWYVNLCS